jgi:peptidoglycan glycosyltransferase
MTASQATPLDLDIASVPNPARRERVLLVLAGLFVLANRVALLFVQAGQVSDLWPQAVWLACVVGAHLALNRFAPERDPLIFPTVMLLAGWGLTLVARLAPPFASRQAIWLVIGTGALVAMTALPPNLRILQRYRYSWLLAGLAILAGTLLFGVNPSGAGPRLWLRFGPAYLQPSEPLKLLLVVFLASYLAEKHTMIVEPGPRLGRWTLPPLAYLGPLLLMWGFCIVLLVWQRDMGAATLFFAVFLAMLYVSTGQSGYVVAGLAMLLVAGVAAYLVYDLIRLRVDAWWNPWPDASDRAFQIVQSLLALAAGSVFGQGVGQGSPYYIPVVHSDFVFAAIAEEWGMLGALGALGCIAILVLRAMRIAANHARAPFRLLLATGIGTLLGVQSLLIMGGVVKLLPLTGVTLPFVSYGGSSLLSSCVMVGLLLRLSDVSGLRSLTGPITRTLAMSRPRR